jgi:hypothetical protein
MHLGEQERTFNRVLKESAASSSHLVLGASVPTSRGHTCCYVVAARRSRRVTKEGGRHSGREQFSLRQVETVMDLNGGEWWLDGLRDFQLSLVDADPGNGFLEFRPHLGIEEVEFL